MAFSFIKHLKLSGFRNYKDLDIELFPATIFVGENGSGKTNILEAISLLTGNKGLKNAQTRDIINVDSTAFNVDALLKHSLGDVNLKISSQLLESNDYKKNIYIQNKLIRRNSELNDLINVLWVTPKMDIFFLDETSKQRAFIDKLICYFDATHGERLLNYEKALRERNRLLKNNILDKTWLSALEEVISGNGVAIAASRIDFIQNLNAVIKKHNFEFSNIFLSFSGLIENSLEEHFTAIKVEEIFKETLFNSRSQDSASGITSEGVHKTKINVLNLNNNLLGINCSTGEQKLMFITIIFGFLYLTLEKNYKNKTLILLMDEILTHLDEVRREQIINEVLKLQVQCFITTTDLLNLDKFKDHFSVLTIENNKIML